MTTENLFRPYAFGPTEREEMDRDGHYVLPGILTEAASASLSRALQQIHNLPVEDEEYPPRRFAAD